MTEPFRTRRFLDAYRAAFEAFDVEAIADLFSYPCQIAGDAGEVTVTTVATREAWVPHIERLVSGYRAIGVRSAAFTELHAIELTSRMAQVTVRWDLADGRGRSIYDFEASYSLADYGNGMRIAAIAHNEAHRLRASLLLRAEQPDAEHHGCRAEDEATARHEVDQAVRRCARGGATEGSIRAA